MEFINSWVNCILATVILIGLIEIIVVEGETKKFVLLISGIVTSIVITTPVLKFLSKDITFSDLFNVDEIEENFYYIDTLRNSIDKQQEILEKVFAENVIREFNSTYFDMKLKTCEITFLRDIDGKISSINEVLIECDDSVDDVRLLKNRVSSICEVDIEKVRVG